MIKVFFWSCLGGLAYVYLGYPLLVWLLARCSPKPHHKEPHRGAVSVVIAAFNEAVSLPAKIASLLRADTGGQLSEILVASDGSTDDTVSAARAQEDPRVRVLEFRERRGKAAVLNDVVPQCKSEIVVLTDARQELHPAALERLLSNFADPQVGAVSGELVFREEREQTAASQGIGLYWNYEKFIRKQEARLASVPGATGAFYALRRELFSPIPAETLLDDVAVPMQVVAQGHRVVFEEGAVAYDEPSRTPRQEAARKRRTIAGNAQLCRLYPEWLLPWRNPIWFQYISHKLGRLASPLLLIALLVCCVALRTQPLYMGLLAAQIAFYVLAGLGRIVRRGNRAIRLVLGVPLMFVTLNATTLLALGDALRGRYRVRWDT